MKKVVYNGTELYNYHYSIKPNEILPLLPHGSGINYTWSSEQISSQKVIFHNDYYMMNAYGSYIGRQPFKVTFFIHQKNTYNELKGPCQGMLQLVCPQGKLDFKITGLGKYKNELSEYLYDCVYEAVKELL
jgi:hypothetical protein